jgi:hypothetical protein
MAADCHAADDKAETGAGEHAERQREFGREAHHLGGVAGDIAAHAEEGGVADGQEADVAGEEIERRGEQREGDAFGEEQRVEPGERGNDAGGGQADEQPRGRARHRQASRPNRPAGRTSRTRAMMMKTMVEEISG